MKIKQFAEKFAVTTDTIRYYEKEGLLHPLKQDNGYRIFNTDCEHTMKLIIVLRQLGFTLQEIKQLLALDQKPISTSCNQATMQLFTSKITAIKQQLHFYQHALQSLQLTQAYMADGHYEENQEKIAELIEDMYQNLRKGRD
ncbi:MerR family transcriptional regulator [Lysinibacillus sp. FSL K6-0232]|uniref:MerR family transcriptional regulator n=1 Tax=unclassified Lysinibacillus TaxID=2636778 RepID=UPI0030F6E42A